MPVILTTTEGEKIIGELSEEKLGNIIFACIQRNGPETRRLIAPGIIKEVEHISEDQFKFARDGRPSINSIQRASATVCAITLDRIISKERTSEVAIARWLGMCVARSLDYTYSEIGREYERNHESVIYAVQQPKPKGFDGKLKAVRASLGLA